MSEIITANEIQYQSGSVTTGINSISFRLDNMTASDAKAAFMNVTSLTTGNEDDETYGNYPDVKFESVTEYVAGGVVVTMHILTEAEKEMKEIKATLAEHDEAIAYMMFGGVSYGNE